MLDPDHIWIRIKSMRIHKPGPAPACLRERTFSSSNHEFIQCFLFCAIFAFLNPHNPVESGFAFISLPAFVSACFILSEHLCLNAVPYAACLYHFVGFAPCCRIWISAHQGHGSMTGLYLLYYFSFFGKIRNKNI
jgi:hypothetical protein